MSVVNQNEERPFPSVWLIWRTWNFYFPRVKKGVKNRTNISPYKRFFSFFLIYKIITTLLQRIKENIEIFMYMLLVNYNTQFQRIPRTYQHLSNAPRSNMTFNKKGPRILADDWNLCEVWRNLFFYEIFVKQNVIVSFVHLLNSTSYQHLQDRHRAE